jgi:hypothetical protein
VYRCVCSTYHKIFYSLEENNELDADNDVDLFALHCMYLPLINSSLHEFAKVWNKHPIRTEKNWTPFKILTNSILRGDYEQPDVDINTFGINYGGPITEEQVNTVEVPETLHYINDDFCDLYLFQLQNLIANTQSSESTSYYIQGKLLLYNMLSNNQEN